MTTCDVCLDEVNNSDGCTPVQLALLNGVFERVPYGMESRFSRRRKPKTVCGDCGVLPFFFHHFGCDMEECPDCGGQQIGCDCSEPLFERPNLRLVAVNGVRIAC
jgi:hypothetical protein